MARAPPAAALLPPPIPTPAPLCSSVAWLFTPVRGSVKCRFFSTLSRTSAPAALLSCSSVDDENGGPRARLRPRSSVAGELAHQTGEPALHAVVEGLSPPIH